MKWCLITKDDICFINLNKLRNNVKIESFDECLKFIHKKNPNKGKLSSIQLKGPYKSNNLFKWIIYYDSPINKNHHNSDWQLCSPDGNSTVYNGGVLIYTKTQLCDKEDKLYPHIKDTVDIDIDSACDWKLSTLTKRLLTETGNTEESDVDDTDLEDEVDEDNEDDEDDEDEAADDEIRNEISDDFEVCDYKNIEEVLFDSDNEKCDISSQKKYRRYECFRNKWFAI